MASSCNSAAMYSSLVPVVALIGMFTSAIYATPSTQPSLCAASMQPQNVAATVCSAYRWSLIEASDVATPACQRSPLGKHRTAAGRPSSAVANAIGHGASDFGVAVGESISAVGTALGGSASVQVNAVGRGATATGQAIGGHANAVGTAVGGSATIVSNGIDGGRAYGHAIGGDASATGDAVGGDATVGDSADDFDRLFNNAFQGDFWASMRNQETYGFAAASNNRVFDRSEGNAAVDRNVAAGGNLAARGQAVGRGRAVGGSAVVVDRRDGRQGGRAVGGSGSVFGFADGRVQVISHSVGETSDVRGHVASGGFANV